MPYVVFKSEREAGNNLIDIQNITKYHDDGILLNNVSFKVERGDKIALVGPNDLVKPHCLTSSQIMIMRIVVIILGVKQLNMHISQKIMLSFLMLI